MAASRTSTTSWKKARARQLREHPTCECGALATEVDHHTPVMDGGTDHPSNLRSVCHRHHARKTRNEQRRAAQRRRATTHRPAERHPGLL